MLKQLTMKEAFNKRRQWPHSAPEHKRMVMAVANYIIKDLQPLSVVEGEGFRGMMAEAEPKFKVPVRSHFSESVLPRIYSEVKAKCMHSISRTLFVALTTDSWTSRVTDNYTTVTAHYIDDYWELKFIVLQTTYSAKSHTSKNLTEFLNEVVEEWKVNASSKAQITITTDNASNITKAVTDGGFLNIG
jgi:hypothetical protein